MAEVDYSTTNDERVRVADAPGTDRKVFSDRYTVFLDDADNSGEEIDLDVKPGTPMRDIRAAARFVVERDYMPGLTVGRVEQRFGMYL